MAYNQQVYEALEVIDAHGEDQKKALTTIFEAGKGVKDQAELLGKFQDAVYDNRVALGLPEIAEEDKKNIIKEVVFPFSAGVKPLYNLAFAKYVEANLPKLSRDSLQKIVDKEGDNVGELKNYFKDTLKYTSEIDEKFLQDDSFKIIAKMVKAHLEERVNAEQGITDAQQAIETQIKDLQDDIKKLPEEGINQTLSDIKTAIDNLKTKSEEIKKFPYYNNDENLQQAVEGTDEAITKLDEPLQKLQETAQTQQQVVQKFIGHYKKTKTQLEILASQKRALLDGVKALSTSSEAARKELEALENKINNFNSALNGLKTNIEKKGLQDNPVIMKAVEGAMAALKSAKIENSQEKKEIDANLNTANMLMQLKGSLSTFKDSVVDSSTEESKKDEIDESTESVSSIMLHQENAQKSEASYKGVRLAEGQYIESKANFYDTGHKALIKQDYKNRVSDFSQGLNSAEQSLVAMKMAKMLMANYNPKDGNIIITGTDKDMGHKVFASLLLLKQSSPVFKNIKIESRVPGCTGPGFKDITNNRYIEKHIGIIHKTEKEASKQEVQGAMKETLKEIKGKGWFNRTTYEKNEPLESDKIYDLNNDLKPK